jgi:hypothetical protein
MRIRLVAAIQTAKALAGKIIPGSCYQVAGSDIIFQGGNIQERTANPVFFFNRILVRH